MKNKTLGAKNLQKVGVFFDIRPYLYINKELRVESGEWRTENGKRKAENFSKSEWRVESGEFDGTNETNETNETNGRNFQRPQ